MIFSVVYLLVCRRLGCLMVLGRREVSKDAELLVLRHENAVLRRQIGRQFTGSFDAVFTAAGIRILASPPRALRANAICERIIGTLRREVFDRMLIVNEHHLRQVLTDYLRHYTPPGRTVPSARSHPLKPAPGHRKSTLADYRIRRKQVLGGLTHEYQIAA